MVPKIKDLQMTKIDKDLSGGLSKNLKAISLANTMYAN